MGAAYVRRTAAHNVVDQGHSILTPCCARVHEQWASLWVRPSINLLTSSACTENARVSPNSMLCS